MIAAAEACRVAWSTTTSRPVFSTDWRIVAVSSGASERASITSALTPSPASCSAAASALPTVQPIADDRHVAPLATHRRLADRNDVLALRHVAVLERQQVVVEEDDRVVVADRRGHQALRIRGRRGDDDLETRDAHEHAVDRARVLAGPARGEPVAGLEHDRHLHLPAGHGVEAGSLVHDLVHGDEHELRHVQLDNRPVARRTQPRRPSRSRPSPRSASRARDRCRTPSRTGRPR